MKIINQNYILVFYNGIGDVMIDKTIIAVDLLLYSILIRFGREL